MIKLLKLNILCLFAEGQLLASVMAKKYSVSANYVLIDIPMGKEVKVKNQKQAKELKKKFERLGRKLKMKVKVVITDGTHPIGNGIGPLLEALDVMAVLRRELLTPLDLRKKALYMAGLMLEMAGKCKKGKGYHYASDILDSGAAYKKMQQIIKAQGKVKLPKLGEYTAYVKSPKKGKIKSINNQIVAKIARIAGAPSDKGAGIYIAQKADDTVKKNDVLYTVYAENKDKLNLAIEFLGNDNGYVIG